MNNNRTDAAAEQARAVRFDLISRLADDVAHELKNPLNSVVINLEVLRNRVRNGQTEGALDRAEVIETELHRLYQLLEAMLRLLRPDRGAGALVPLGEIIEEVAVLAQAQARVGRKALVIEPVRDDLYVRARRDSLRFVLLHVLHLALDAADGEDGTVRMLVAPAAGGIAVTVTARPAGQADLEAGIAAAAVLMAEAGILRHSCEPLDDGGACTVLLLGRDPA